jgi:glutamate synthase domain-containing protein 3
LENWVHYRGRFVKVMPLEYRKVLASQQAAIVEPAKHTELV